MTNIDDQLREDFHHLATRYQGDDEPPKSVLLGVRHRRRATGIGLATVTGAAVVAIVLAATSVTNLESPRPQPTHPAGAGLPAGQFVGLRPSRSDVYAWTFSATTGRPVQRLAKALAVVGITADRRRVLIAQYRGMVCTVGFSYLLVSVTTGEITRPFPAAYHVTSAAVGGQTAVGVAATLAPSGSGGCGSGDPPRSVPGSQTLLVRDLSTGQLRSYPIPSVFGDALQFGDVLQTGGVAAVSPDGRWAVLVNRPANSDHQTAYLVSIDPGVTSLHGTEIRAAPPGCLPPVKYRSPYDAFAFRPSNQLTVNRFCGRTMTIIDYDPAAKRQAAAVGIPDPPGLPVTYFTTSWDRTGTDAMVETVKANGAARKIYILRDGGLHPINTEAYEVTR